MTLPPDPLVRETHRSLVKRIAGGDGGALRLLYAALRETAIREIRPVLADPRQIQNALHATFVEVWWLARFHTEKNADITGWVRIVAAHRAAELGHSPAADDNLHLLNGLFRLTSLLPRHELRRAVD